MKRHGRHWLSVAATAAAVLVAAPGCGGESAPPTEPVSEADVAALVSGNTTFGLNMYRRLAGDGNLFFSPYSISAALGMTWAGARGNTEEQMAATLGFPPLVVPGGSEEASDQELAAARRSRVCAAFGALEEALRADPATSGYTLHVANSLWGQEDYQFLATYLDLVGRQFGAGFNLVDFVRATEEARLRINAWVEEQTREKIKDLIPPGGVDKMTTLVLTNAVYFKGDWASQFDEAKTADAPFHGQSGDTQVPLMYQKADFGYLETEEAQILELRYKGDELSMVVVLPVGRSVGSLEAVERSITPEILDGWIARLSEEEVRVYLPRFELTWGTEDVSDHLRALGMVDAFNGELADFSGMTGRRELFIGPVFHKAYVKVNEEGTEAAAATAVVMKRTAMQIERVFRADHPFMFVIRDNRTGGIMFMGRITDLA